MADLYSTFPTTPSSPSTHWTVITPSDTADLPSIPKAIYVSTGGDIAMIGRDAPASATGVVWRAVPSGSLLPCSPRRILATGTTATGLIAVL